MLAICGIYPIFGRLLYIRWSLFIMLVLLGYWLSCERIILPWSFSSVPYASLLVYIGSKLKKYELKIRSIPVWTTILMAIAVFVLSREYRLDICWNFIIPIIPITIAALVGVIMIICISIYISDNLSFIKQILRHIGQETYIVVAYSQLIIITFNYFGYTIPIFKYPALCLLLVLSAVLKNTFVKTCKL